MPTGYPRFRHHKQPAILLENAVNKELTHALIEQAREFGWRLVCLEITKGIIPSNLNPIGAVLSCFPSNPLAARLREMGCPTVHIASFPYADDVTVPYVHTDLFAAGSMAADHFAERNFQHLAYVGRDELGDFASLFEGFQSRGRDLGCTVHFLGLGQELDDGPASIEQKRLAKLQRHSDETRAWLKALPKPVGFLAHSSHMAGRIFLECDASNLKVPEQVAIVSRDINARISELAPVPLSSIDLNYDLQGREALKLLKRLIDGNVSGDRAIPLPPKGVTERQSTSIFAVEDPRVVMAIRYLWDNLDQPITDDDVARDINVPFGTLRRLFRQYLGRSINEELRRKRLEHCCELLRTTDMSVSNIVKAVGFRSSSYLHKTFLKAYGQTPRNYRMQAK